MRDSSRVVIKLATADRSGVPAELGNWGQPFRKMPWFAVRNLNGTIDELAIINAGLTEEAIQALLSRASPWGIESDDATIIGHHYER